MKNRFIRVINNYLDKELKRIVKAGEIIEVSNERAEEMEANQKGLDKVYIEVIKEIETAKKEDIVEKAVKKVVKTAKATKKK